MNLHALLSDLHRLTSLVTMATTIHTDVYNQFHS